MAEIIIYKDAPTPKRLISCYVVNLESMSGDGDHYEKSRVVCNTEAEALKMLTIFYGILTYQEHGSPRISEEVEEKIQTLLIEQGFSRYDRSIPDLALDYIGKDITCDQFLAILTLISVSWFNDRGEEKLCRIRMQENAPFVDNFS